MNRHVFGDYVINAPAGSRMDILSKELKKEFPKLKMAHKRTIWYHRWVHWVFFVLTFGKLKTYISAFTTTTKNKICWGDGHHERIQRCVELDRVWACLQHERVHLRQFARIGMFLMTVIWLIPPILFCFGRALYIEKPAYKRSLWAKHELGGDHWEWAKSEQYKKHWVGQFVGPNYGWMWVIKSQVERWYDEEVARLEGGTHGSA